MWLILSTKQEGFVTRDGWTKELEKSRSFTSKDEALDFVRAEIADDQRAEVFPIFVGARVVELLEQGRFALRKYGPIAINEAGYAIVVSQEQLENARKNFPREMYGYPIVLHVQGHRVPWTPPPSPPASPVPAWAKKKSS